MTTLRLTTKRLAAGHVRVMVNGEQSKYTLSMGSYRNACDDCIDSWYIDRDDSTVADRRGRGYSTIRVALDVLIASMCG